MTLEFEGTPNNMDLITSQAPSTATGSVTDRVLSLSGDDPYAAGSVAVADRVAPAELAIAAEHVSCWFGKRKVLEDVSFAIETNSVSDECPLSSKYPVNIISC